MMRAWLRVVGVYNPLRDAIERAIEEVFASEWTQFRCEAPEPRLPFDQAPPNIAVSLDLPYMAVSGKMSVS